ncbi:MAG: hypothetical protein AB1656_06270 [Candidatus Omnitrophota bacterium]
MKLLVDKIPVEVVETDSAQLSEVIERISKELQTRNRVISEIYVNGRMMGGWDDPSIEKRTVADCEDLRLISEEPRKLAHKVLYDIAGYMNHIQEALVETSSKIQSRNEQEGMRLLENVTTTWAELYKGLQNAVTVTGLDFHEIMVDNRSFLEINEEMHKYLDEISDLVQEQRFLELSDILEYEIAPRIPLIREGIYKLIKELEKKPH